MTFSRDSDSMVAMLTYVQIHDRIQQQRITAVKQAIKRTGGNKRAAAKLLGVSRQHLYNVLQGKLINKVPMTAHAKIRGKAGALARMALKGGIIERASCRDCGSDKAEMHHPDYNKPLEVIWLCRKCHRAEHKRNPIIKAA